MKLSSLSFSNFLSHFISIAPIRLPKSNFWNNVWEHCYESDFFLVKIGLGEIFTVVLKQIFRCNFEYVRFLSVLREIVKAKVTMKISLIKSDYLFQRDRKFYNQIMQMVSRGGFFTGNPIPGNKIPISVIFNFVEFFLRDFWEKKIRNPQD